MKKVLTLEIDRIGMSDLYDMFRTYRSYSSDVNHLIPDTEMRSMRRILSDYMSDLSDKYNTDKDDFLIVFKDYHFDIFVDCVNFICSRASVNTRTKKFAKEVYDKYVGFFGGS